MDGAAQLGMRRRREAYLVLERDGVESPQVILGAGVHLAELDEQVVPVDAVAPPSPLLLCLLLRSIVEEHDLDVVDPPPRSFSARLSAQVGRHVANRRHR